MGQFSDEDKAIIKNDFLEKGWCAYTIWKEHAQKKWNWVSGTVALEGCCCTKLLAA